MPRWLAAVAAGLVLAGCGADPDAELPVPPPPRTVPATTTPSVVGDPAGCPPAELRRAVEREIPIAPGVRIAELRVLACRNDYAQVLLVAEEPPVVEPLPVFLHRTGDGWVYVDSGGHIDCSYPESLPDATVTACRALGL